MSKTISIAASTTWGPQRNHLAAVVAALIAITWALSLTGVAQARPLLEGPSQAQSFDPSSPAASSDGHGHAHSAGTAGATIETPVTEIDDGVNLGLVTAAVAAGLLGVTLLALGITRRRAMSLP